MRQLSDIEFIKEQDEFDNLPADLKEAALLRIENPEASLQEIGELLSKPIGRSGVTRRFQKIAGFAENIRKNMVSHE